MGGKKRSTTIPVAEPKVAENAKTDVGNTTPMTPAEAVANATPAEHAEIVDATATITEVIIESLETTKPVVEEKMEVGEPAEAPTIRTVEVTPTLLTDALPHTAAPVGVPDDYLKSIAEATERAVDPANFERRDETINVPTDVERFVKRAPRHVRIAGQNWVVFSFLVPGDLKAVQDNDGSVEAEREADAQIFDEKGVAIPINTEKVDTVWMNVWGVFPNCECSKCVKGCRIDPGPKTKPTCANCHAKFINQQYNEFNVHVMPTATFAKLPPDDGGDIEQHNSEMSDIFKRYFGNQSTAKDNHMTRINKDVERANKARARMREVQKRHQDLLRSGVIPTDEDMERLGREVDRDLGLVEAQGTGVEHATPKDVLEHEGYTFGREFVTRAEERQRVDMVEGLGSSLQTGEVERDEGVKATDGRKAGKKAPMSRDAFRKKFGLKK